MGERSIYANGVLTLLLLVNLFGFYFVIDSYDLLRKETVALQKTLENQLAILQASRNVATAQGASPGQTAPSPSVLSHRSSRFANQEYRDPDAVDGDRLIIQTSSFTGNLNVMVNNDAACSQIWGFCHEGVAERNYNRPKEWEPLLADHWTFEVIPKTPEQKKEDPVGDEYYCYTIYLRPGILWHPTYDPVTKKQIPPKELTSDDFLFYWELIRNPDVLCTQLKGYWEKCKGVEVIDRYTFRVVWKEPYSEAETWTLAMNPMPRHYYQPDPEAAKRDPRAFAIAFNESPRNFGMTGVGPYRFDVWDKDRKQIILRRWEGYYGLKPHLQAIILREQSNPEAALIEFEKGVYDQMAIDHSKWKERTAGPLYYTVTPDPKTATADSIAHDEKKKKGLLPKDYQFERYQQNGSLWRYIGWNMARPLFADPRVRVALTHLVNRARIIEECYWGLASPISGPFVPRSSYYDSSIEPWPFSIEEGKRRLREAGWEDTDGDGRIDKDLDGDGRREKFSFTLTITNSNPVYEQIAQILKDDFGKAGIEMNIKSLAWPAFLQVVTDERNFDATILGWVGGFEGDPYQLWHSKSTAKGGSNFVHWINEESDALIEQGRITMDKEARCKIYHRFHRLLHEYQPYTFLCAPANLFAIHRRFRNIRIYQEGMPPLWVPKEEQRPMP